MRVKWKFQMESVWEFQIRSLPAVHSRTQRDLIRRRIRDDGAEEPGGGDGGWATSGGQPTFCPTSHNTDKTSFHICVFAVSLLTLENGARTSEKKIEPWVIFSIYFLLFFENWLQKTLRLLLKNYHQKSNFQNSSAKLREKSEKYFSWTIVCLSRFCRLTG